MLTKPWREIVYPSGKTISQVKRYIQKATLFGNLNMPIYESKLVNLLCREIKCKD